MTPVTEPKQDRSRRTQARILDAAEAALHDKDFDAISILEIAAGASCSVGAFYARFSDKEALRESLIDRYLDDLVTASAAFADEPSWRKRPLEERVEAFITAVVTACRRRRGLMRMRYLHLITRAVPARHDGGRESEFVHRIESFFEPCLPEIDHPEPRRALSFALRLVDTMAAHAVLFDQEIGSSFGRMSDRVLIDELVRAFLGYLGAFRPGQKDTAREGAGQIGAR
ncbi:MAG TPA: TetR/AcrR family transcriptional regulator [Chondromyces sp.]|nr:TetR/AcrR family transcriptional regulator [Chondromyces sp.]